MVKLAVPISTQYIYFWLKRFIFFALIDRYGTAKKLLNLKMDSLQMKSEPQRKLFINVIIGEKDVYTYFRKISENYGRFSSSSTLTFTL